MYLLRHPDKIRATFRSSFNILIVKNNWRGSLAVRTERVKWNELVLQQKYGEALLTVVLHHSPFTLSPATQCIYMNRRLPPVSIPKWAQSSLATCPKCHNTGHLNKLPCQSTLNKVIVIAGIKTTTGNVCSSFFRWWWIVWTQWPEFNDIARNA